MTEIRARRSKSGFLGFEAISVAMGMCCPVMGYILCAFCALLSDQLGTDAVNVAVGSKATGRHAPSLKAPGDRRLCSGCGQ